MEMVSDPATVLVVGRHALTGEKKLYHWWKVQCSHSQQKLVFSMLCK